MGEQTAPSWLDDRAWSAALGELDPALADVYFTPEYHALHETNGDGRALCFASDGLLVPGLEIAVSAEVADIQTCNGYGGPLAPSETSEASLARSWNAWREQARARRIVAALFRLHPVVGNRRFLPADAVVRRDRQTVFVDGTGVPDARHRNMLSKAARSGAQVRWNVGWDAFISLYREAMKRLSARSDLNFSDAYFAALRALPAAEIAVMEDDAGLAAAAVFLWGPRFGHYHLAARRPDAPNFAASLLVQAGLDRAVERRLAGVHLGGGTTTAADDPLLRFKRSLGGRLLEFEVALVIADEPAYRDLVAAWQARTGRAPTWLLGYRQPA